MKISSELKIRSTIYLKDGDVLATNNGNVRLYLIDDLTMPAIIYAVFPEGRSVFFSEETNLIAWGDGFDYLSITLQDFEEVADAIVEEIL